MRTGAERKGVTTRTACASGKRSNSARRGIPRKLARRRGGRNKGEAFSIAEPRWLHFTSRGGSALRQGELGTHDRLSHTGNFDATGRA